MTTLPPRFLPHAVLAALAIGALGISAFAAYFAPLPDSDDEYNAAGFVVKHAWVKFALILTTPLRDDLSRAEEDAKLARFFELNALIAERERTAGDPATAASVASAASAEASAFRDERAVLENAVELILEERLANVVRDAGLSRHFGGDIVWPPISIEFEPPPAVLVTSPRDEIRRAGESLLDGTLPIERIQRIEERAERDGATSALVVNIGGIATYPAIIPQSPNYRFVLQDIAHEWLHHYLFFAPLGRRYYESAELRTLNETVANLAGNELGDIMFERYPLPERTVAASATVPAAAGAPAIDFTREMRELRRRVEALLRDSQIVEAERLMEEKRGFLADNGYYIRKLNQAYFAFHGSYADSAGSIDPIGPKLDRLRQQSASVEEFVETARELTSDEQLDAALGATP